MDVYLLDVCYYTILPLCSPCLRPGFRVPIGQNISHKRLPLKCILESTAVVPSLP